MLKVFFQYSNLQKLLFYYINLSRLNTLEVSLEAYSELDNSVNKMECSEHFFGNKKDGFIKGKVCKFCVCGRARKN